MGKFSCGRQHNIQNRRKNVGCEYMVFMTVLIDVVYWYDFVVEVMNPQVAYIDNKKAMYSSDQQKNCELMYVATFEVFTAVLMKIQIFHDVTPCRPVNSY